MSKFKCPSCGHEHEHTGTEVMRVVGGEVRRYDDNGQPVDICPECESLSTFIRRPGPIQAPGLNFTDSGTGRKIVK